MATLLPAAKEATVYGAAVTSLQGFPKSTANALPIGKAFIEQWRMLVLGERVDGANLDIAEEVAAASEGESFADVPVNYADTAQERPPKKGDKKRPKAPRENYRGLATTARGQEMPDPYETLGLLAKRWRSNGDEITVAYRKKVMETHPDKVANRDEAAFVRVQESYELLMNEERRRAYDSQYDVNDAIPTEAELKGAAFYTAMGAAFARNARWSIDQPVPALGDASTPMEEVDACYEFWRSVKSWRSFVMSAEYSDAQIKAAQDRFDRRHMLQANETEAKKLKAKDNERLYRLVTVAYDNDPRIIRRRLKAEVEKAKAKQAEDDARKAAEAERAAAAEAAARESADKEKVEREARAEAKKRDAKRRKESRRSLRKLADKHAWDETHVERVCNQVDCDAIDAFVAAAEGMGDDTAGATAAFVAIYTPVSGQ